MSSVKRALCLLFCILLSAFTLSGCAKKSAELPPEAALAASALTDAAFCLRPVIPETENSREVNAEANAAPVSSAPPESREESAPLTIRAAVGTDAALFSAPGGEAEQEDQPAATVSGGQEVQVAPTGSPFWYALIPDDPAQYAAVDETGAVGYLYGENLYRLDEEDRPSASSLFAELLDERLQALQEQYPAGKYWNHMGMDIPYGDETPGIVTDIPCSHSEYGELYCNFYNGGTRSLFPYDTLCECLGFASLLSDRLFGTDAGFYVHNDPSLLRVGDHIRLREYEHSMTVVRITDAGVEVAEVNEDYEDCLIGWGRIVTWDELYGLLWDSEYISRYPLALDGNGGFTAWPSDALPPDWD